MLLGQLLKSVSKKYQKIPVEGICFDSRKVKKNYIFFAIEGNITSGSKFINEAISFGASAVICGKKRKNKKFHIPLIIVKDVRKVLSEACSNFYKKKPSNIIAVTGTNGKSSVADFFYQILNFNNIPVASIGTLGVISKNYRKKTNLTSMDPLSLHKNLQILAEKKINNVILEASSHGLQQKRLDNLKINTGIFTNFSHDHLDYHKNMESYFSSKMYLFNNLLKKNSMVITDEEIDQFKNINKILIKKKLKKNTIGRTSQSLRILNHNYKEDKQIVKISINSKVFILKVPLIGFFQIKNLLMAALSALQCGLNENKVFKVLHKIKPVLGRLELVAKINNSNIIVDFAHTPDALSQTLVALKKQFKKEIIIVFGCGGDRDKKKRISMGKIANKYCKKIFITDDNPRNEDPKKIRQTILKGCKKKGVDIGKREKAIRIAIKKLNSNEILLVAGKGHEETQDYGSKILNFSDKKIIRNINYEYKPSLIKNKNYLLNKAFNKNNIENINYKGVSINTKTIKKNNLFFAIQGKKTDGHMFLKEAIKKGAIRSVISKEIKKIPKNKIIKVKNTFSSLNNLANVIRNDTFAKIIGITGSVGKTTLKNLISFSLENYGKVYHSPHSYNNKFGVPLSLCNLESDVEYGVFEIGMDKEGEIDNLSNMVKPEIAIITNVSEAHLKNFKSVKDIAKAKSEIINNISKNGNIILNKESKFFNFLSNKAKKSGVNVISFSLKKKSDIFLLSIKKNNNFYRLKVNVKDKIFYFNTKNSTNNFIKNILACISTMFVLDLDLKKMEKKFISFKVPEGRGDIKIVKKYNKKFKFIDESYNANPLSMTSAINNLHSFSHKKNHQKFVLLGDMLELGKKSIKFHRKLSTIINKSNIDKVFVYGTHIKETFYGLSANKKGKIFSSLKEAHNHFSKIIHNNDLLMVKGSNATGLNQFSNNIKKGQISAL